MLAGATSCLDLNVCYYREQRSARIHSRPARRGCAPAQSTRKTADNPKTNPSARTSAKDAFCLASYHWGGSLVPPRWQSMSRPSPQPGSAAPAEASRRSPTLSRPTNDEIQTLLAVFTARRPAQGVTFALRNISAICSNLVISRNRIVIDWFKTTTGLVKGNTPGRWAYDSWDYSQKIKFGRSLKEIEKNVSKAAGTEAQAVLDVLVRRGNCPGCFQESL